MTKTTRSTSMDSRIVLEALRKRSTHLRLSAIPSFSAADLTCPMAVPARLEHKVSESLGIPVRIINAGIPGASIRDFTEMARYVRQRYAPEMVLVYLKVDDLSPIGINSRLERFSESVFERLLVLTGLDLLQQYQYNDELLGEVLDQAQEVLPGWIHDMRQAVGSARLLIFCNFSFDNPEFVRNLPQGVTWIDNNDLPCWGNFESQDDDPHWSAKGAEQVASCLQNTVERVLRKEAKTP